MTTDNIEEIKTAFAAMKEREAPTRRSAIRAEDQSAAAQSDLAELKALLAANPDLGKLVEILARRDERRESLLAQQHRRPDAQEAQAAATAATAAINARRQALSILSQPFTPPYYVTLDTPGWFLVLPSTELSLIQDFGLEPGGSWFKALLNTSEAIPADAYIKFYFVWANPSDYYAVANVSTFLLLNGWAKASAQWALINRWDAYLNVNAELAVYRWSGWGTDPDTGQSLDQTPYPGYTGQTVVARLDGWGGNIFSSPRPEQVTFNPAHQYEVSAPPLMLIPGGAVTVFEVGLYVDWSFSADGVGKVVLDLADNGYMAQCPLVQLELLTGPPT
jgi:hypothetical protein